MADFPEDISRKRCFHHTGREAAALCLSCGNYFCRECITEHEGKVMCAGCLAGITAASLESNRFVNFLRFFLFSASTLFLWFIFFQFGRIMLKLPDSFHEGTLWKAIWQNL